MNALIAAAKKEGQLTVIALPRDWVNYGELIDTFSKKYGIKVNELNPEGSSGEEIEAIRANKNNKGPQAPDVIDVGLSLGLLRKKRASSHRTRYRHGIAFPMRSRTRMGTGTETTMVFLLLR